MKTLLVLLACGLIFSFTFTKSYAAEKIEKAEIKTSSQCENCKERIEKGINKLNGIKESELVVDTKILKVTFDSEKIKLAEIREAVSKIGYDADDVKSDPRAYKRLPKCCQLGGHK